jgi:hypothetical protein
LRLLLEWDVLVVYRKIEIMHADEFGLRAEIFPDRQHLGQDISGNRLGSRTATDTEQANG